MKIELYPSLKLSEHSELITFLNKVHKGEKKLPLCVDKSEYFVYYCDEGIYNIINDKVYITDIYKNALETPLDFTLKHKNNYVDTKLAVNYTTTMSPMNATKSIHLSCLPFHHIKEKHTKYSLYTSKQSNTRCDIIFNNHRLVDVVFHVDLPIYTEASGLSIDTYIKECIENTRENPTNVYNETFYSLFSTIIYML